MSPAAANYNERSWAIDLIGHLKLLASRDNRSIRDAGGEQTVRAEGGSLFPDVLLFGDRATARILQGWELKMPDTGIDDPEFRENAELKARALGLDSFLLWNVTHAHLYTRAPGSDRFERSHAWDDLRDVTSRTAVPGNRARWESLATEIFGYLNDLFDRGSLQGRQFIDAYRSGGITSLIMENAGQVEDALKAEALRDAGLRAEMALWWDRSKAEYAQGTMEAVLAQAVISNWIGKLLFAHILRERDVRAQRIASIDEDTTPQQALDLFGELSRECNFWTVFSDSVGLACIPGTVWSQLKQFNRLLSDLRVGSIDQAQLSAVLEATAEVTVRKLRGQYPTPLALARLLVHLCVRDIENDRILDPCCGSGTIPRAAMEQKLSSGTPPAKASSTVYASDQDPQAVLIATFALAKPDLMHLPMRIFQRDAFTLEPGTAVEFRDPADGTPFTEVLGSFQAITSNLPFVAQEGRSQYGNALDRVARTIGANGDSFTRRADVAAYLPFALHPLLADDGRLGIIITNAWLGTDWGDAFYESLGRFYELKSVITSGARRWFQSSEVVANILILRKKTDPDQVNGDVQYVVLTRPLEEMADDQSVQIAAAQVELGQTQNDTMTIRSVSQSDLARFRRLGLGGNAQFVNCDWALGLPLVPLSSVFDVTRGERRGKNALFYPRAGHGIEADYIRPLAKGPADFIKPAGPAMKEAFACSKTEEELEALGHEGALNWIRRFKTPENIQKLSTSGCMWYEMKTDELTDLVAFINYGSRLFFGRVDPPAFVDQRLVPLKPRTTVDIELWHALLNTAISMFFLEGMGFGRGLGALDLNKDRIQQYMHVLDPSRLDSQGVASIKAAYKPLAEREVLIVADELEQEDRCAFDDAVIAAFGLQVDREQVYDALRSLVAIRLTALE